MSAAVDLQRVASMAAMDPAEREARIDLAAAYRLAAHFKWTDLIYTHFSAKIPGTEHILINPFGLMFDEITASSLVKLTLDGEILSDSTGLGINRAGYVIHSCIHRARPDAHAIMHTHSRAGVAVSAMKCGLLPLSQHAMRVQQRVTYHGYEGIALELDEQERLVRDLGPHAPAMILRNHGLLAVGASTHEAFEVMYYLECACQIQVDAMAGGIDNVVAMPAAAADTADAQFHDATRTKGARAWTSLLRMLDRLGSDFRD
ncbi:class II aldolase/adducin family protein [Pseudaquabacterium terrae]